MRKIEILTKPEQVAFDSPPNLSTTEQMNYFTLTTEVENWVKTMSSPTYMVGFVLLWGYVRCKGKFFQPKSFLESDINFICEKFKFTLADIDLSTYNQRTFNYHKQKIRQYLQILPLDDATVQIFEEIIRDKVSKYQSPKHILLEVADILKNRKIEIPGYNRFTAVISSKMGKFEINLAAIVGTIISQIQKDALDQLLEMNEDSYILTQLKNIDHDRSPAKITNSVKDFKLIKDTYHIILPILTELNLHVDTIKHCATWVRKASFYQVQQLESNKRYLFLICFISHQYCLRQDIIADTLLISVRNTENSIIREEKTLSYQHVELNQQTINILSDSRISYKELIKQIESVIKSSTVDDTDKIFKIDQLIINYRTQQPQEEHLEDTIQQNISNLQGKCYYDILEDASLKLQNRVSDIMRHLSFEENDTDIYKAIAHYQLKDGNVTKTAPTVFLSIKAQDMLENEKGKFRISLYKALLFIHATDALKAGIISLKPSYRYLSLENYLYSLTKWQKDKNDLLTEANLAQYQDINQLLVQLQQILDQQFKLTNKNITSKKNEHIKFDAKNKIVLNTPKVEKPNMKSVSSLFAECKFVPILKILHDVQQVTDYLSCLRHLSVKDKQILPDIQVFYAAILALGCNIGVSKMANVSRGISEDVLVNLVNWHISLDNVNMANQKVLDLLGKLSLASIYQKSPNVLHTSSDGRKIAMSVDSLNANSSYKYFGKGIGITNYSFIDEFNRSLYATAISSAEREAAYVIDGLMHNPSINSNIHSTDTHGYSEAIFAVMFLLGIDFAPRIKGVKRSVLYGFVARKIYEEQGFKILPDRYINTELITAQWDNILRLVTTIKLRETSASQIFKRLSSYSKQHPLYCAMKEFGRIAKTIFILRYIDDVELRQAIEKQLNRIELSNKFAKAISFDNNHEMQYSSKEEQDIAINCQRLIQNIIVLWNELYLSEKLATCEDEDARREMIAIIKNGLTLLWQHANFQGEYDFTQNEYLYEWVFNMDKILALQLPAA